MYSRPRILQRILWVSMNPSWLWVNFLVWYSHWFSAAYDCCNIFSLKSLTFGRRSAHLLPILWWVWCWCWWNLVVARPWPLSRLPCLAKGSMTTFCRNRNLSVSHTALPRGQGNLVRQRANSRSHSQSFEARFSWHRVPAIFIHDFVST